MALSLGALARVCRHVLVARSGEGHNSAGRGDSQRKKADRRPATLSRASPWRPSPFHDCSVVGGSSNAATFYACLRTENDPSPVAQATNQETVDPTDR